MKCQKNDSLQERVRRNACGVRVKKKTCFEWRKISKEKVKQLPFVCEEQVDIPFYNKYI